MNSSDWRRITARLSEQDAAGMDALCFSLEQLRVKYGQVWDSFTLARDFEVEAFAPGNNMRCGQVVVIRKVDGVRGTVSYQHCPRYYWSFEP